jgi:protoporphyrinogen oxidase
MPRNADRLNKAVLQRDPLPDAPHVAILGAGPAGLGAALFLARKGAKVTVLERRKAVGGNAGSFQLDGIWCDYGSHRFHPAADPLLLKEVQELLGEDLLWRPRHGRILLKGRWIHFPLKAADLALHLPKGFAAGLLFDALLKSFRGTRVQEETFASILERGLGPTMCRSFYFPYARKLWGVAPEKLAVTLAKRRVSGSSVLKILSKITRRMPGLGQKSRGGFYYPRHGYGTICNALQQAAVRHGANFLLGTEVLTVERNDAHVTSVRYHLAGQEHVASFDAIWSTLPISLLVRRLDPPAPSDVLEAAKRIRFRGMILIYLVIQQAQFSEYDAHYFPELTIPVSRISEPKNYSAVSEPPDRTILCAELPADPEELEWALSDEELGRRLCTWLAEVGLPVRAPVLRTAVRRLNYAYPVYDRGFEAHFKVMDDWLTQLTGLLTFGRQGLFAHDNTHHALAMAYAAADCFSCDGEFNRALWSRYRQDFENHVVED